MTQYLSKSNYLFGLQCHKLLWYNVNSKESCSKVDEATQHRFDEGHEVGNYAKKLFPDGIECFHKRNDENIKLTVKALKLRKPIFEAGLKAGKLYARADILVPVSGGWNIIEVKSASNIKEINYYDVAYQRHVFSKAGLKIMKCFLLNINTEYVRKGEIDVKKLFIMEDITEEIDDKSDYSKDIKKDSSKMLKVLNSKKAPKVDIGMYCDKPYTCPLQDMCWKHIPENSVFNLCGNKACWELYEKGIILMKDIPPDFKLSSKMQIQLETIKSGKSHIEKRAIKEFLKSLKKPYYYFDFETFATAVPLYDGIKPYQQVPFQYSLHVQDKKLKHYSYLCLDKKDPRPELISTLKKQIGTKGSIIVYNASFEMTRLEEMAKVYPKEAKWIRSLYPRIIDLYNVFSQFNVYYSSQGKSASFKDVLPALTGKDYKDMEIGDGGEATRAYLNVVRGKIKGEDIKKTKTALEIYCGQDTEGMVWIIEKLRKISKKL